MSADIQTVRNDDRSRYEGRIDGELVTVLAYVRRDDVLDLTHTATEPEFRRRGLAGGVTRAALDDVRHRGEKVHPSCPFAVAFLDDHPEYADLRA
ncbi:MAG: GNAT family N-acetyltransferase [Janthinobacterium lividum]